MPTLFLLGHYPTIIIINQYQLYYPTDYISYHTDFYFYINFVTILEIFKKLAILNFSNSVTKPNYLNIHYLDLDSNLMYLTAMDAFI